MGGIFQTGEFWLPPEFFTGDGILADETEPTSSLEIYFPAKKGPKSSSSSYSSAFSSPVESVLGSTETDSDEDDETGAPCAWSCADVAEREVKMMRKNGVDEEGVNRGTCHVAFQSGPPIGVGRSPLGINHCASFYANQFPIHKVEPNNQSQVTHRNNGYILERPSIDLLYRQIQLQQLISQHRSRVLYTNQLKENAHYSLYSPLGLPYLARTYGMNQKNKMSIGDSLGIYGQKQTSVGTGVFIPRPNPPVAGRYIARNPPRFFQVVDKSSPLITAQPSDAPHRDTSVKKKSGSQLDSFVKHEQCLPQEWSY